MRQWFKRQERAENIARGKEMVEKEMARLGTSLSEMQETLLKLFKFEELDDFFLRVGYGEISAQHIANKAASVMEEQEDIREFVAPMVPRTAPTGIRVLGTGDLLTRLSKCCNPVPGDEIIGYVTRGEGVSVHRRDCRNIVAQR